MKKIFTILKTIIILFLTVVSCFADSSYKPIIVTAKKIISDYEANEIAADNRYKNKVVQVKGIVDSVSKDFLGGLYIVIKSGDRYALNSIHASFPEESSGLLSKLKKGDNVTVTCDGKGFMVFSVMLSDCIM
jgi:hypothetical protein